MASDKKIADVILSTTSHGADSLNIPLNIFFTVFQNHRIGRAYQSKSATCTYIRSHSNKFLKEVLPVVGELLFLML